MTSIIRNISIRNKLIMMQVLTSITVLGICFAAFVITDIRGYKERKVKSMQSIAEVIGSSCVSAIEFLDNDAANFVLRDLQRVEPEVINASILDGKGNVFAFYSKEGNKPFAFASAPGAHSGKTSVFDEPYLFIYRNIVKDGELIGTVCLRVELLQLEQIKKEKFQISIVLLVIGLTLAFVIAIINQRYISNPLLSLVNVMKKIRQTEDYKKHVPVVGKDEISTLSLEFNNLMDQVVISSQKKDEFIGVASHELKTPLTSLKGYLQLLEKLEQGGPNVLFIKKAQSSLDRLERLVYDLLDVSKIQAGQLELRLEEFDIDKLLDECIADTQMHSHDHLLTREGDRVNQLLRADKQRIEQVIVNLLSNSIKYSRDGHKVIITSKKADGEVVIGIRDFGAGIPKAEQKKIFERFYRSSGNSFGISGFGLGLYICHQIISRHDGKIWVDSKEGEGTTFYFSLPLANGHAVPQ